MALQPIYISTHGVTVSWDKNDNDCSFWVASYDNITVQFDDLTPAMEMADNGRLLSLPFENVDCTQLGNGDYVELWSATANNSHWCISRNDTTGDCSAYVENPETGEIKMLLESGQDTDFDDCAEFLTSIVLRGMSYNDFIIG